MCVRRCKPPFEPFGRPCPECAADYAAHVDDLIVVHKLQKADRAARKIVPATDAEYYDHLIRINDSLVVESQ